jgi:transcriptional regulator with XRE-family HTH domain
MTKVTKLRLARLLAGLSQFEAGLETGIDQPRLSLYERGLVRPKPEHLARLAKAYGVMKPETLLEPVGEGQR